MPGGDDARVSFLTGTLGMKLVARELPRECRQLLRALLESQNRALPEPQKRSLPGAPPRPEAARPGPQAAPAAARQPPNGQLNGQHGAETEPPVAGSATAAPVGGVGRAPALLCEVIGEPIKRLA